MTIPTPAKPSEGGAAAALAYAKLADMIRRRLLGPDDRLSERALAARLGMSRTPVREALRRLEGEGMLRRRTDGMLVVPRLDVEEMLEVLQVRRMLEPEAAAAAAGRVPAAEIARLRVRVQRLAEQAAPDEAERLAIDLDLHEAIGRHCGNRVLAEVIADLRRRMLFFVVRRVPQRVAAVCGEHLEILDALETGDASAAHDAMERHVNATRSGLLGALADL